MMKLLGFTLALFLTTASGAPRSFAQAPSADPPKGPSRPGPSESSGSVGSGSLNSDNYPAFEKVMEGYEKVVSTTDGEPSLYTLWVRKRDGQMLAELPRNYASQKYFIAMTVASGELYAGLQAGEIYAYWKPFDKRLALIEPNVETRSNGDSESKASVKRLFTDRVILDVPIVTVVPRGGPVIDVDELLVNNAGKFFGGGGRSGGGLMVTNNKLLTIKTAKAFPNNVEIAVEVPTAGGRLQTLHYSISLIPDSTGYTPRVADERVGFFTTAFTDLGKYKESETRVRHINRWHLEKADKSLEMSPPKNPIVFIIEHTTPIRYRRWVREGILYWNKAFEKVGISDAIEVYYQDATTGAHMDKDPEDVRYNFVRWLNNNIGTAIGPSRVHPLTGQILDADIILTDGWIRHFWKQFNEVLPEIAVEGFSAETLTWLDKNPNWDPRIRLAPPAEREGILTARALDSARQFGGHPMGHVDPSMLGDDEYDGLIGRHSQVNGLCLASRGKAMDVALMQMQLAVADDSLIGAEDGDDAKNEGDDKKDEPKKPAKKPVGLIDGMPEKFIGPLLAELVAHEVGHTLGLRHNFKASGLYTLAEINSDAVKGKKPFTGSVMDYIPVNIDMKSGELQGDYTMIGIGPYDYWAIEYGYTFGDLKPVLARVAEPELQYATDEDTGGPDPLARRYDFSKNPLDHAKNVIRLAEYQRGRLIEKFVKDGESWSKARAGYELTLASQTQAISTMASWIGGASVNRDKKGDKDARVPVEVLPCKVQREAIEFVINHSFFDEAFALTPELLARMTVDKWLDGDGGRFAMNNEPTWPVHDRVMGIQASVLTMIMNPTTLRRVYDNELRVAADKDALTLPELMETVGKAVWKELEKAPVEPASARKPLISSLRRNLQREHMERLIDLTLPSGGFTAAQKPISNLATMELRKLADRIGKSLETTGDKSDPYTVAHLTESKARIAKALDAQYIYNARDMGGQGAPVIFMRGGDAPAPVQRPGVR